MSVLDSLPRPPGWQADRFDRHFDKVKRVGHAEEPPLSVFLGAGVVPRDSREDNHNRLGADLAKYQLVQPGDLVFNRLRTWQGGFGASAHRGIVSPAYIVGSPRPSVDSRFVHFLMLSSPYLAELTRVSKFMPPSQFDILWEDLRTLSLLVPPLPTQKAIADFLDRKTAAIDELIAKKQRLLDLLAEKRAALINQAVTKGLDPSVPVKDTGIPWIGEIPAHWHTRKLRYIAAKLQGRLIVQPHLYFSDDGVPIVFGYNIKDGEIDEQGLSKVSFEADAAHPHARARAGDLYTVRLGMPGMTAVVPPSLDGCHFASIMWVHQHERADSHWLCHAMNSAVVQGQIDAANYGATLSQFNIAEAVDWVLPFPPKEEQQAIACFLSARLDTFSTSRRSIEQQTALLQEYRQALITAAVTGQLEITEEAAA